MDLLLLFNNIILIFLYTTLFLMLVREQTSFVILGMIFEIIGLAVYFPTNPAFEMLKFSRLFLKAEKAEIRADILKVAHHGSKTSSIPEFIKAVKPKIALIGVGKNNTFGHPNKQTIKNLENIKCRIYRTDIQGEIIIKIDQKGRMNVKSKLKIK